MFIILTLALALISFISSCFVILRTTIPMLPPNPLSRKVPPSEFGLPNRRSLKPADKSHLWLASLDIFALAIFLWQALGSDLTASPTITHDALSSARVWLALTTRQTCLLIFVALTLLYVRRGRSVNLGPKHCFIWVPTAILVATGASIAAILSNIGMDTLWGGLAAYSAVIGILTTASLGCLIGTLLLIRHNVNMAAQAELEEQEWPPRKKKITRRSIGTDDLEALKEGASWITSHQSSSSRQLSISAFSFSTAPHSNHGTSAPVTGSQPSVLPKSAYWFGIATPIGSSAALISHESIPPVPRVPSPFRDGPSPLVAAEHPDLEDPFHRSPPRHAKSSANSWLTSPAESQVTLSEFSFPTTRPGSPTNQEQGTALTPTICEHPISPPSASPSFKPLSESQVLGGYARQSSTRVGLSHKASKDVDISVFRCIAWTTSIWFPLGLSLPYLFMSSPTHPLGEIPAILLIISITASSPLLALNIICRAALPIPTALFSRSYTAAATSEHLTSTSEIRIHPEMQMRGRSSSVTVVDGRRSGDVWIERGEAVDGRGKAARVLGLLSAKPKLSVLPFTEREDSGELTPPLPIQDESSASFAPSSPGMNSVEMGIVRSHKSSSHYSGGRDESLAHKPQIMFAQRHYSAMATTVHLPPSQKEASGAASGSAANDAPHNVTATGVQYGITKSHMRSLSASSSLQTPRSSMQHRFPLTPPPASPLPPTPPNVRALQHSRSQSSSGASGFSFGPIGNTNQIDSLSAGLLPLLVPGLVIDKNVVAPESRSSRRAGQTKTSYTPPKDEEFGFTTSASFSSPQIHSTPARPNRRAGNRWKHFSLPSLGLSKDGVHSLSTWKEDLVRTLDNFEAKTPATTRQRRTVYGGETGVPAINVQKSSTGPLNPVVEDSNVEFGYAVTADDRRMSALTSDVTPPTSASVYSQGFNTARSSMATMVEVPTSATALLHSIPPEQGDYGHTESHSQKTKQARSYHLPRHTPMKRSSVVYIKSDENALPLQPTPTSRPELRPARSSAKQPIPKSIVSDQTPSPLRKLTLLGNQDLNRYSSGVETPALSVAKKSKKSTDKNSGLRPLRLARSATAKARGLLRQEEVLPDVVVRPPSTSNHSSVVYSFR